MKAVQLGVIGLGSVVREIYQYLYFRSAFSPILDVCAVCDVNNDVVQQFGDEHRIPEEHRFTDYRELLEQVSLEAVQINTPDHLHRDPAVEALKRGIDVVVPKPLADRITDAHAIIEAAHRSGRFVGVDFHKRADPRIREAAARVQQGQYGTYQTSVWYMLDKLMVANPNHEPRFFVSPDFASRNSPVSFLTVHMADALLQIIRQRPVQVRVNGWKQKLPSLKPIAVDGYDVCETQLTFDGGGTAHIVTGWHVPDGAHALTIQSARLICTNGMLDLGIDTPGYHEVAGEGIVERNPLFRNFSADGAVDGYGITNPGRIYQQIQKHRAGELSSEQLEAALNPITLGFWTTAIIEAAHRSLEQGRRTDNGAVFGADVDITSLVQEQLGDAASTYV
jgi:predicted dehydrogenase